MTTDHFDRLGVPRNASLDVEELKARYHELARAGPGTEGEAAALNAAFACLSKPSTRLRHLLELFFPEAADERQGGAIPDAFIEVFSNLATAIQDVDAICARKQAATSALSKALVASDEMEARETLEAIGVEIQRQRDALETCLFPEIDAMAAGMPSSATLRDKLSDAYRAFGFLDKWQGQVRTKLLEMLEAGA